MPKLAVLAPWSSDFKDNSNEPGFNIKEHALGWPILLGNQPQGLPNHLLPARMPCSIPLLVSYPLVLQNQQPGGTARLGTFSSTHNIGWLLVLKYNRVCINLHRVKYLERKQWWIEETMGGCYIM
jgi:hypothetical protein